MNPTIDDKVERERAAIKSAIEQIPVTSRTLSADEIRMAYRTLIATNKASNLDTHSVATIAAQPRSSTHTDEHEFLALKCALTQAIATIIRKVVRGEVAKPSRTVRDIVDTAAELFFHNPTAEMLNVFYAVAAEQMRIGFRRRAEAKLAGKRSITIHERVNEFSLAPYAGGPQGAIDRDERWKTLYATDPRAAQIAAMYRFTGRYASEIATILNIPETTVVGCMAAFDLAVPLPTPAYS